MKIYRRDRRTGKTTQLIKESHDKWRYIICANHQRAGEISKLAQQMGLDIPFPITVGELPIRSQFIKQVLVDDVEDVLQSMIGKPIDACTTSCEIECMINEEALLQFLEGERYLLSDNDDTEAFEKAHQYELGSNRMIEKIIEVIHNDTKTRR